MIPLPSKHECIMSFSVGLLCLGVLCHGNPNAFTDHSFAWSRNHNSRSSSQVTTISRALMFEETNSNISLLLITSTLHRSSLGKLRTNFAQSLRIVKSSCIVLCAVPSATLNGLATARDQQLRSSSIKLRI